MQPPGQKLCGAGLGRGGWGIDACESEHASHMCSSSLVRECVEGCDSWPSSRVPQAGALGAVRPPECPSENASPLGWDHRLRPRPHPAEGQGQSIDLGGKL